MLKAEHADRYPSIPVSMWTSAVRMAHLVASRPRGVSSVGDPGGHRRLPNADFEFRGGAPGRVSGVAWTRAGEPDFSRP